MTRHKLAISTRVASGILSFTLVTACGGGGGQSSNSPATMSSATTGGAATTPTNPIPDITGLSPDCTPLGVPFSFLQFPWQIPITGPNVPSQLSVAGHNFDANSIAQWSGNNRPTTLISSHQLRMDISAADIAAAAKASITVYNPAPGGGGSNTLTFTVAPGGLSPTSIAVDPSGKFASVASQGCGAGLLGYVSRYAIDSNTGLLSPVGDLQSAYDEGPRSIAASPAGQFVYVANSGNGDDGGSISGYSIEPTGGLEPVEETTGPPCAPPPSPGSCAPWSLAIDATGRFVYAVNEGGITPTSISAYSVDLVNPESLGILHLIQTIAAPGRALGVTLDPSGKYAYVVTSDDSGAAGAVSTYSLDATSGSMTYGETIAAGVTPVSVVVDRGGRFAYAVNSGSNNISMYTISAGKLTLTGIVSSGQQPVSMSVDPTTKFAYIANSASNDVSMFEIDATTGALASIGTIAAGVSPASIAIEPTGKFAYVANTGTNDVSIYAINSVTGALTLIGTSGT
jgi:6-phosphogluconolactonase (cycloisomerase 2 family)